MTEDHLKETDLKQILSDDKTESVDGRILRHIDHCSQCQKKLEQFAAEDSWWVEAQKNILPESGDDQDSDPASSCATPIESGFGFLAIANQKSGIDAKEESLFSNSSSLETLGRLDEFEVEEQIGQGGMGVVYRGFDHSLNRPVAIKIMSEHLGQNTEAKQRFQREAEAAAAVVHPGIIPIYKVGSRADRPYISMAYIDGCSLQQWVEKNGPCDVFDVVRISLQIASALSAAHKVGLIHRDIKPANVLMQKEGNRIVLTDFGLAKAVDDIVMTQSGTLAGTPAYMSPEHIAGKQLDHRSDLFSLGSLMFFITTGREPFSGSNAFSVIHKIVKNKAASVQSIQPKVPTVLARIIERLLEKNPKDRFDSAAELETILENLLAHLHKPDTYKIPKIGPAPSTKRFRLGLVAASILLAVSGALGGFFFFADPKEPNHSEDENPALMVSGDDEHNAQNEHSEHPKNVRRHESERNDGH